MPDPDQQSPMEDLVILAIRYVGDQISPESLEQFLQSKELQTQLNKAVSEIAGDAVKKYNLTRSDQAAIQTQLTTKIPQAVSNAFSARAGQIYKEKYKSEVETHVKELGDGFKNFFKEKLGPGVYILEGAIYIVVGLGVLAALHNRRLILNKAQEVCKPDKFLCSKISQVAVLSYVQKKEIGKIEIDANEKVFFSPTFEEMTSEFVGNLNVRHAKLTLKTDFVFDLRNNSERLKTTNTGLEFSEPIDHQWTVGGKLNLKQDFSKKTDQLDLSVNFGAKSNNRKIDIELGVSDMSRKPEYGVKVNLTLFNW